jgi:hypothetical protein
MFTIWNIISLGSLKVIMVFFHAPMLLASMTSIWAVFSARGWL